MPPGGYLRFASLAATAFLAVAGVETWRSRGRASDPAPLVEVTREVGLDHVHFNGMTGALTMVEVVGPGAGLLDYDGDGDLDVYLVQGALLGAGDRLTDAVFPPPPPPPPGVVPRDRLYRNDLTHDAGGRPVLRFTDVTAGSGIDAPGHGMGVACGDIDNDGRVDLYLTQYGPDRLFRNRGDGTFEDVTAAWGLDGDASWTTSASFVDHDGDGWLDLYVCGYIDYRLEGTLHCTHPTGRRDYCGPESRPALADRLYRNTGEGHFEDVSRSLGMGLERGPALGVVSGDLDGDGRLDFYVANDGSPNHLWLQVEPGRFAERALLRGCANNGSGQAEAGMGVDAADVDGDGDLDLFSAHLLGESNTLYINTGKGWFEDRTATWGLDTPSRPLTCFGAVFLDLGNDGALDLVVGSGGVQIIEELYRARDPFPLHQPNLLFRQTTPGRFETVPGVPGIADSEVTRGIAVGDLDNDGDADLVLANNSGPARVLSDPHGQDRSWVGFRLVGTAGDRDMLGSRVEIRQPGRPSRLGLARSDGSYLCSRDPRALFGLGDDRAPVTAEVVWPGGDRETFGPFPTGQYHTLRRGR